MKRIIVSMVVLAGLCGSASMGWSAINAGDKLVGINIGAGLPSLKSELTGTSTSDTGEESTFNIGADMGTVGINFEGFYLYHLTPNIGIGADAGYFISGEKEIKSWDPAPLTNDVVKTKAYALFAEVVGRYVLMPQSRYRPYGIVGLGIVNLKEKFKYTRNPGEETLEFFNTNITGLEASAGLGFEFEILDFLIIGVDARWRYLGARQAFTAYNNTPANIQGGTLLSFGGTLTYKFGKK